MANAIKIKGSEVGGDVPLNTELVERELAMNLTDARMFTETSANTVIQIANAVKYVQFVLIDKDTILATPQNNIGGGFRLPISGTIVDAGAYVDVAGSTSGNITVDIGLGAIPTSIFTTKITLDTTELTSETATTPRVINPAANDYTKDDLIQIDLDAITTGGTEKGLKVWMTIKET